MILQFGNLLYDNVPVGCIWIQVRSGHNVQAESVPPTKPPSLTRAPSFSTHLRSNSKKAVDYKQRALSGLDTPVSLTSLYICSSFTFDVVGRTGHR